jgi:hypothetical protein
MTTQVVHIVASRSFIFLSAVSLVYVAIMALLNPQAVMDLVGVQLTNTDAISSIRGVYGGVGITLFVLLCYLGIFQIEKGLVFLSLFWGSYSLSRIITWMVDGALGDFGTNWMVIEGLFCVAGIVLLALRKKLNKKS